MPLSMMIDDTVQTRAANWKFELSPGDHSFRRSPDINYICVPTTVEFKKKIISSLQSVSLPCQNVLVQFWAPKEIGDKIVVLTTTCQPFGISGNNKELQAYHKACLDHKLYVYRSDATREVAFGLAGWVFLYRTSLQTQDVHDNIPTDHRPPCNNAIFSRKWGSFVVPVIQADKCVGVLEFIMDTPKDSYDEDIGEICTALQYAGFQSSIRSQTNLPRRTYGRERSRTTSSSKFAKYRCLVPYFGLSSLEATHKLGETTGKLVKLGTFKNGCRDVGIFEWPWISKRRTVIVSSDPETQVDLTTSGTNSFTIKHTPSRNMGISKGLCVQAMTTPIATEYMEFETSSFGIPTATNHRDVETSYTQSTVTTEACLSENSYNQIPQDASSFATSYATEYIASDTSSFRTPMATEYGSFGFPANPDHMVFDTSSFGAQIATKYMESDATSFIIPTTTDHTYNLSIRDVGMSYTQRTVTTEAYLSENRSSQIPHDASNFPTSYATEYVASDTSSFGTPYATDYMASDTSLFGTPMAREYDSFGFPVNPEHMVFDTCSFGAPIATKCMESQTSYLGIPTATDYMSNPSSFTPIRDIGGSYTQSMGSTESCLFKNKINQTPHDTSFATREGVGIYEWSSINTMNTGASLPKTLINRIAPWCWYHARL